VSEYDVAGGLAGSALELVRCKTVDLLVPSQSEIVVEGNISLELLEMEGPFAEFTGYMAKRDYSYFMDVTCITMKKRPIYAAFLSQFPPSESSKLRGISRENAMRRCLLEAGMDNILDVHQVEAAGSWGVTIIRIRRQNPDDGQRVFDSLVPKGHLGKIAIVVDEDVDIRDPWAVFWAMSFRMQPHRDVRVVDNYRNVLDPSIVDCASDRNAVKVEDEPRSSLLLIDATRDWDYPPIALPNRETMERALAMWKKLGLTELNALKQPWHGYDLGYWSEEDKLEARLALEGRYFETGEKQRTTQRRRFD
jgi:4-hydroxy-3-polyprenylbenzoate decarboxylase